MRILNSYTGGIHEVKEEDKMLMAHHRAIGGRKCAGAYNTFHLVGPVKKARFIWQEWLAMCQVESPGLELPWKWARLKQQRGPTALRHHVLVSPKERENIREQMKLKEGANPMFIRRNKQKWVRSAMS